MENGMINYKTFLALIDEIGSLQEKVVELEQCLEITRAANRQHCSTIMAQNQALDAENANALDWKAKCQALAALQWEHFK